MTFLNKTGINGQTDSAMLKIHNLSFAIDGKPLFDNASAVIRPVIRWVLLVGMGLENQFISVDPEWKLGN